jgi:hypothetical protein
MLERREIWKKFRGKKKGKKMVEKREVDERLKERKNQRTGVDVLSCMVVTAVVFHLERSALNTDAKKNAVKVNAVVDPIAKKKSGRKNEEKRNG